MLFLDIETNGLNPDTIWCVCVNEHVFITKESFLDFMKENADECIVGHNLIGYDLPVLDKLWGFRPHRSRVVDTLVLARLADPSRSSGHSLGSYGESLGFPKGDHSDWSKLSDEMVQYCKRDVQVTIKLYGLLMQQLEGFSQESIDLEHQVAWIIKQQQDNGFLLDVEKARDLVSGFKTRLLDIEAEMHQQFPPIITERWSEKTGKRLKDHVEVFNVGSRKQIAKRLQTVGVEFKGTTEKGNVIVDEKALAEWEHIPEAKLVLEYLLLQKRKAQVSSWLELVEDDGRVHGKVRTNGAVTGRMTHNSPNMAQVPSCGSPWGPECRECWTVPKGYKLVGADASGLELRMLAHYMDDEEYTNAVINGKQELGTDVHSRNQSAAGLPTRNAAKTFIYAFLYGAGDAKIGSIIGEGKTAGAKLKQKFLNNVPSLSKLRERVAKASGRGHLMGLDGRRLYIRSEHAALNTLLQGAGAIVMKKALCILDEYAKLGNIDYRFVANVHDEWQVEVREDQADRFGWLAVECIKAAGFHYDLRCPLDGEYKVGNNWKETH